VAGIRVVEVLAALSLTTDLASGVAFEKGLRTCAVAAAFGRELGLPAEELSVVFHTALVRAIGCTSHAPENADDFDDDIAFQAWLKELDFGDEAMLSRQLARFGAWAPGRQAAMTTLFLDTAAVTGTNAWRSSCEVGRAVGPIRSAGRSGTLSVMARRFPSAWYQGGHHDHDRDHDRSRHRHQRAVCGVRPR
jgi:hypothetical protein